MLWCSVLPLTLRLGLIAVHTSRSVARLALGLALSLLLVEVVLHHSHDRTCLARVGLEDPASVISQKRASQCWW